MKSLRVRLAQVGSWPVGGAAKEGSTMSNSTRMPGHAPRHDGEASLPGHHGEGGASIGKIEASGAMAKGRRDGKILDTSSPVVRALRNISPLCWWRSAPADAFRATEYLAVPSALEEVGRLIDGV